MSRGIKGPQLLKSEPALFGYAVLMFMKSKTPAIICCLPL